MWLRDNEGSQTVLSQDCIITIAIILILILLPTFLLPNSVDVLESTAVHTLLLIYFDETQGEQSPVSSCSNDLTLVGTHVRTHHAQNQLSPARKTQPSFSPRRANVSFSDTIHSNRRVGDSEKEKAIKRRRRGEDWWFHRAMLKLEMRKKNNAKKRYSLESLGTKSSSNRSWQQ